MLNLYFYDNIFRIVDMSRLGKKPITIPEEVNVSQESGRLIFKGKKGDLFLPILPFIKANLEDKQLVFEPLNGNSQCRANWGTMASLAQNMIEGVNKGFEKKLIIEGVGYRAKMEGASLLLNVGFSHPVKFDQPQGTVISVDKNTITVQGIDKNLVGQTAAQIRKIKKPEPYKGKGIHYEGEVIRRKAGKKAAGATA